MRAHGAVERSPSKNLEKPKKKLVNNPNDSAAEATPRTICSDSISVGDRQASVMDSLPSVK